MPGTDEPLSGRPMPSSFDENHDFYNEKPMSKILRKLKEEPLIPLGAGLTVFAFTAAYRAIRRGDSATANRMFRARVAAQGFTVLAMVAGGMYYNKDRQVSKEITKLKKEKEGEEKRQKWIRELEARDEEEKAMKAAMMDRKARAQAAKTAAGDASKTTTESSSGSGSGVLGSLGLSGWGKQGEVPSPSPSSKEERAAEDVPAVMKKIKAPIKAKDSGAGKSDEASKE